MPTSGSGTGTPITPEPPVLGSGPTYTFNPVVTLPRYAELIGYDECAFWGVAYEGQAEFSCATFWSEWQRQNIARALVDAQKLIENHVGFPLAQAWIVGETAEGHDDRYVDQRPWGGNPVITRWARVISGGIRATATISAGATVDYTDPETSVVGPLAATLGSTSEIKVYYPGTNREIIPSRVTYAGGNVTIEIPRCRLLLQAIANQTSADAGADNDDLDLFLPTVAVVRVYNDPSVQAVFVQDNANGCSGPACEVETVAGCITVKDQEIGIIHAWPGIYSAGSWSRARLCGCYSDLRLNYRAGLRYIPADLESVIVRLAHALMPEEPCGCALTQNLWKRDHHIPEVLTRERINCPFGMNDGAWFAYTWAKNNKVYRAGII